ncbi:uncharacterized protein E0L32_004106 [Thyridium curvatum]|uniref:DUF8021 domain-containing protein n=1 Tax=Thyridium curvatum TaxID=1093900 RepID=A0A507BGJ9_9PEZI|nr:uncharacterized protein E0L32_004106 [Thyridium curvatum]TPX16111.1 hypothetical protein E0L32_004106 [Thyridium curvatum]
MRSPRWSPYNALLLALLQYGSPVAAAPACDRTCLEGLMSAYLAALTEHDPSRLNTTSDVLYTENSQILPLGTGEWKVAGSPGKYRHDFSDPEARQVGTITTITENGVRIIYIARLGLNEDGMINEIETQITRDPGGGARYENMTAPEAVWLEAVPTDKRISRQQLVAQTNKYYTGMQGNDPHGDYSFFDKECNRLEDALQTTNQKSGDPYGHSNDTVFASLGCEAQFQTGFLGFVTKIRARRFPVVDEERQAVLAFATLDHNGTVRTLPEVNGTASPIPPYFDVPRTLQAAEAFRLRDDKLYRIEMTLTEVPYGMRSPFVEEQLSNLTSAGNVTSLPYNCDRRCLHGVVKTVLQAMLTHDPATLPLAKDARYTENGQLIAVGDGLWETLSNVTLPGSDDKYAASFADPRTQTAVYWGMSTEQTTPGVLAMRIRVAAGKLADIEVIDVRAEATGNRGGTMTLMRPPLPVEWDGSPLGELDTVFKEGEASSTAPSLINDYFNGLQNHSSAGVAFAPECLRRDNGQQLNVGCANQLDGQGQNPNGLHNLTTAVRDRRLLIADAEQGVALAVAMVDSPAVSSSPLLLTLQVPSTYMVPQLFKVDDGAIARVEGMVKWMPFGYRSAWGSNLDA